MTEVRVWVAIVASVVLPLLLSIPNYVILIQNRKSQEEDEKKNLSDEAIELYDRMKVQADEFKAQAKEFKTQVKEFNNRIKTLETKLENELEKREELEAVVSVLETRQKHYEKYIDLLVQQLKDHNIKPAKRPPEIDD